MKVGLIDVDGYKGYPNFALMKVSAYHKARKHKVEWVKPDVKYDVVYASKVFTFTDDYDYSHIRAEHLEKGGTGYDIQKTFPDEIEDYDELDYTLYPDCEFSLVFFSRGCPNRCKFCLVSQKEGNIRPIKPVKLNPDSKWIDVLDNNFFANPEWKQNLEFLKA